MGERERRIGRNEALFREVNEHVESLNRGIAEASDRQMHIVCECGDLACAESLTVPIGKYEEVRGDATLFFVKPGHEAADIEAVVEHTVGFDVVRKHAGDAQLVAEETDPRS
jgi:hypothetical protein